MESKSIHEIHTELLDSTSFSRRVERIMFEECIESYYDKRFFSSCTVGMVLFEKIFFSRLHTLTYLPEDFESTTENVRQHMEYYMERERVMIDGKDLDKKRGMTFYDVTGELLDRNIISSNEKKDFDEFYRLYRVPVQHGLTLRLYEQVSGKEVINKGEYGLLSKETHKKVTELVIRKIYEVSKNGGIWG